MHDFSEDKVFFKAFLISDKYYVESILPDNCNWIIVMYWCCRG